MIRNTGSILHRLAIHLDLPGELLVTFTQSTELYHVSTAHKRCPYASDGRGCKQNVKTDPATTGSTNTINTALYRSNENYIFTL